MISFGKLIRGVLLTLFLAAAIFGMSTVHELNGKVRSIQPSGQSDPLWVASQLQFELLRLQNDLGEFALGYKTSESIGLRFDIAWSRINIIKTGKLPRTLKTLGVSDEVVTNLKETFVEIEPAIAGLSAVSLSDEERVRLVENILAQLDGYDQKIRAFLLNVAHAKTDSTVEASASLLSLSNALRFLGVTIFSLILTFTILLLLDLRRARNAETAMRQLAKEASSAAQMKINFMTVVSHELRTPLTSILGGLSLLKRRLAGDAEDEMALKLIDVASRNGDRLLALINDVLDAQALEEGKVTINPERADLNEIVASAVESCQPYAERFGVNYAIDSQDTGLIALTDESRVVQVLVNLISNATKFSSAGQTVEIRLKKRGQKARIEVVDHGMGIPHEQQKAIFSSFYQVNPGTVSAIKGSGLGLNISQRLIELLGGTIGFHSVEGEGTTFWIEIDLLPDGDD
ncbi:hypothetical protein C0U40_13225 [Amylibacter cionae]|nr:hypothetical protein C0U40_13225 [Amylibacter cionae]